MTRVYESMITALWQLGVARRFRNSSEFHDHGSLFVVYVDRIT
jgi:hypothetical protein